MELTLESHDILSIAGYDKPSSCGSESGEFGDTEGASVGV